MSDSHHSPKTTTHSRHSSSAKSDCPTCYGQASSWNKLPACRTCPYLASCRWYIENPDPAPFSSRSTKEHFVSFESVQFSEAVASMPAPDPTSASEAQEDGEKPVFSANDMRHMLEFLLRDVDDYSLAIVECALRTGCSSNAELARAFCVSREAMHRKLIDTCRAYPPLASVLRCILYRCARLANPDNRESIAGRRVQKKSNINNSNKQMEFKF